MSEIKTMWDAIDAYIEAFDEGPPTIGWDEQTLIEKVKMAIERGRPIGEGEGPEADLPDDALL